MPSVVSTRDFSIIKKILRRWNSCRRRRLHAGVKCVTTNEVSYSDSAYLCRGRGCRGGRRTRRGACCRGLVSLLVCEIIEFFLRRRNRRRCWVLGQMSLLLHRGRWLMVVLVVLTRIRVLILELVRTPNLSPTFSSLLAEWPNGISTLPK